MWKTGVGEVSDTGSIGSNVTYEEVVRISLNDVITRAGRFEMEDIVMAMMDEYPDLECESPCELYHVQGATEASLMELVSEGLLQRDGTWFHKVEHFLRC